ncbi:Radical SAM domain protein [Actinokineospora spheciospongiae]|uniref:Radical SAM domain protein n=1 Tax=Actinokineospora spheciospongiae TaxID=909613 RepID=W7J2Z8_9PSEU|nr:KedN5 family methylcobalamin-dependent radical SAM C-methyltransferase [Actinokineospora spheciospongiae]EWC63311.1 Radical SAM domain protein [Actinokineospora spheciospongiae]
MHICLVQQGAWDMPVDSMPLAAGYLKAVIAADPDLAVATEVEIRNFRGGVPLPEMTRELFRDRVPDVIGFSVLGWNYRNFGMLAETFKQVNPRGTVLFGGNHVAYQAERVFREFPWVDVVINGEGETTFAELVRDLHEHPGELAGTAVAGLSVRRPDGSVHTTAERERIGDLDTVPSPFLTGAIPMTNAAGHFPYDVALMETNRGCPYKCSFCYWGGAVGQKMRSFSTDRLAHELDMFGFHQVPSIVLCDSNFGLLEADEQFVEMLIKTRERYGFPRALETSWAKNKSNRFYDIVRALKKHDFKSSFTLALQTLSDDALTGMLRKNMKVNQWEGLVTWLNEEGLDCYAELIWGAPGETPNSFLRGYDRLATMVSRIAVYPMLLLPNTSYTENRGVHGFVTIRGESDDFEYVLANRTSTVPENLEMQRFMYWARVLGENQYLRHTWQPLRDVTGLTQSQVVTSLMRAFEEDRTSAAVGLVERMPVFAESPAIAAALRALHGTPELEAVVGQWWEQSMVPEFPPEWRPFARELYRYERWCRPVYVKPGDEPPTGWYTELVDGEWFYVSEPVEFGVDVEAAIRAWSDCLMSPPRPERVSYTFQARCGFHDHLDNHETAAHYMAVARPLANPALM